MYTHNAADVVKVRLQLVKQRPPQLDAAAAAAPGRAPPPPGLLATGVSIVRHEGVLALWSGLGPSLARGLFFGGARLGLYTPIKALVVGDVGIINSSSSSTTSGIRPSSSTKSAAAASLELKVLAGSLSGGLAAAVTSPIELIKTRLQVRSTWQQCAVIGYAFCT